jgi:thioredoxin-like negative regulator of GroEL
MQSLSNLKEYQEAIKSGNVIILIGSSTHCPACETLTKHVSALKQAHCTIYKILVQSIPEVASSFSIRSVPAMLFFKDGVTKLVTLGSKKTSDISRLIEENFCTK